MKIEIVTGFACNNACKFCSVGDRKESKPTALIKGEIDKARREAPDELNLTGGEPTIRKDLAELLSHASGGFRDIRITTNGRMLSYEEYTRSLCAAGLTGAIFSLHSHKGDVHDYLTSVNGSFEQALKGFGNLSELCDNISVNTVINSMNIKELQELAGMLIKLNIRSACLIFPTVDGNLLNNLRLLPRYSDASVHVVEAVKAFSEAGVPAWALNIPACFLPGHENISNLMDMKTKMYWMGMETDLDRKKFENNVKPKTCSDCKAKDLCPGVPSKYASVHGTGEVSPITGPLKLEY